MEKNLAKTYDPKDFEDRIYEMWESNGAFHAEVDPDKKPFTIVMPPPNITGQLHMGHALDQTLQDVLTRFKRLQGYSALWLPGSDHASIATEVKVVDRIRKEEGLEKEDLGREEFLKRAWDWKKEFGGKITRQCRKLGDSCDWSRERFTMDEGCNKAVNHFFVKLYRKGLIYKGNRLINWCPECGTSLSDAEVEHEDKNGMYWYFRYPAADGGEGVVVATSRPETMFGDVAIAVHPDDERYKDLVGKNVILPLVGREIPVIADPYPDPEKGTGAVKITPAHDPNDFEVGQRHNLENLSCIDFDARMNGLAGKYEGMDRYECRKAWVKDLDEAGYLIKTEEKVIPVGECYRCHTVVEPMLSDQWFVKMEVLAKPAIEAAKSGALTHVPERFEKTYLHWLEEIRDWCISRQLWWGHRIPAYYCQDCGELMVEETAPHKCSKCGSTNIKQDEDVLDTWFSSALWPFSTLGWPEETEDLKYFYPTDVLVTGYDIIFFWVVRMVFSALETTGEVPFHHVYVHGLVRDAQGRKMSKSLGNGIDPLEIIDQYGADALRFMLTTGITPGNDMRFKTDKLESARNFANKLWNASRFVIMNLQDEDGNFRQMADLTDLDKAALQDEDKWIISRVNDATKYITETMEKYDLALAGQRAYDLIWNEFCDWYIELSKARLNEGGAGRAVAQRNLVYVLDTALRLLHPVMPFVTEAIWEHLPIEHDAPALMVAAWPDPDELSAWIDEPSERAVALACDVVSSVRSTRAHYGISPRQELAIAVRPTGADADAKAAYLREQEGLITSLARLSAFEVLPADAAKPQESGIDFVNEVEVYTLLSGLVDFDEEKKRLEKRKAKAEKDLAKLDKKLGNENFLAKAAPEAVEKVKAEHTELTQELKLIEAQLG